METSTTALSMGLIRPLYEFIFPPACFGCDGPLREDERKVCGSCWATIRRVFPGEELYEKTAGRLISEGSFSGVISSFLFEKEGTLQELLHHLKYNGITDIGVELGRRLGENIKGEISGGAIAGMIPVPLHAVKRRERGYNQSESICEGIRSVTGLPVFTGLLKRKRYTQSQTHLEFEERKANVANAFVVDTSMAVSGRSYLIVDDVITTGATMNSCARALADSGAREMIACSVALAK